MARIGLGDQWRCVFANDISEKKGAAYCANFADASSVLRVGDVGHLRVSDLPQSADLVWGSFPCQDLSLAGSGSGLDGCRSGVFWPFWKLICELGDVGRRPGLVVLENVTGALTSHNGADFVAIMTAIVNAGYRVGALTVDAAHFLPQSRPRLFLIAVQIDRDIPADLQYGCCGPRNDQERVWHSDRLLCVHRGLSQQLQRAWVWWKLPVPKRGVQTISDLLEPEHTQTWHSNEETERILRMMSPIHLEKLRRVKSYGVRTIGTIYKRTRSGKQRAEVRFDGVSGCLRTPEGGSSRQIILQVEGSSIRSRLLTTREAARLMGIPDSYRLPQNYNEAYHLAGDGLAVPVVSWIERHLLTPLAECSHKSLENVDALASKWELFTNA